MSVQTILHKSIEGSVNEAIKGTIKNCEKHEFQKRFKLGKGYCENEQFHNSMIIEINNFGNCELTQYINCVIENGPDNCFKLDLPEEQS